MIGIISDILARWLMPTITKNQYLAIPNLPGCKISI